MSLSELLPSGPAPRPALPIRDLILGALAEAVITRRTEAGFCGDCRKAADGLCGDHRDDSAVADGYEAVYKLVTVCSSDRALLVLADTGRPL
jgi:hypothetical protein